MTDFVWTSGPGGSNNDQPSEPVSGFAARELKPEAMTRAESIRAEAAASSSESDVSDAPLTRREVRERERAAALAAAPPSVVASQPLAPQQPPAAPAIVVPEPAAVLQQRAVSLPAPLPTPSQAEAPVATTESVFLSSQADAVAASDSPSRRSRRVPKRPKALRPVKPPRGISRPRKVAVSVHPSVVRVQPKPFKRRMLRKLMTFGAMVGAGLMMVSTTIPANAFYDNSEQAGVSSPMSARVAPAEAQAEVQSIRVEPELDLSLTRDGYTATSFKEQIFLRYGNRNFAFTNNPNGTIQWPFSIAVPISSGFGPRVACSYCSSWHKGVDFTPGVGSVVQAIADGVVSSVTASHGGFGNHVIIDHQINGQLVQSLYAHMLDGSMRVEVGQTVKVTDPVGLVGTTGASTGPHLHLEIHINGVAVDPFEWLKANTN